MEYNGILSLLGLALRGGNLVVGEAPVDSAVHARDVRLILLASDAADNTRRRVKSFAEAGQCLWLQIPASRDELGRAVGRTSAAIVALTDTGLAGAVARRLAELDPAQYSTAAQRLELKARRAAERKAEPRAGKRPAPAAKKAEPSAKQNESKKTSGEAPRRASSGKSRLSKENRPKPRAKANPYAHSRPVKKGKGSFRRKDHEAQ